jgi:hypothetical protein
VRDPKLLLLSLVVFVAWVVAATGWVRLLAAIWLLYPLAVICRSLLHARRRRA